MEDFWVIGIIVFSCFLLYKIYKYKEKYSKLQNDYQQTKKLYESLQKEFSKLKSDMEKNERDLGTAKEQLERLEEYKIALINRMDMYIAHKCEGYHHLAGLMADMRTRHYEKTAKFLKTKKHPAIKAAKNVLELKQKTKEIEKERKILEYKLAYICSLYPNIEDIFDDAFESSGFELETEETTDRVRFYLEPSEYNELTPTERNQLALDRYVQRKKTKWQIGRDYELYIGYLCEQHGYKVEYTGIEMKLEDMGRDLIVFNPSQLDTYILQCKNWSQESEIHEKHIFQLYGSVVMYKIENPLFNVKAVFVTTTKLSAKAKQFADALDIEIKYVQMAEFPRIKCNIGTDSYGENVKIYHLPFDLQYDKTKIKKDGEMYATTVEEAESAGFRRAYRWHGTQNK